MRSLVKNIFSNALSLFLVSLLFSGLSISGGLTAYLYAGGLLALFSLILDPVVKFITLPFNIITLGLLSFLTTLVALFILDSVVTFVTVSDFVIPESTFGGIQIGRTVVSGFLSFAVISATIYFLNKALTWVFSN